MATPSQPSSRDPYMPPGQPGNGPKRRPWGLLLLLLLLIVGLVIWEMSRTSDTDQPQQTATTITDANNSVNTGTNGGTRISAADSAARAKAEHDATCVAGLNTEEVLSGLRQRNFRIDTLGGGNYRCVRSSFGADYEVKVTGNGGDCVRSVDAWVKADGLLKNAQATQDFFHYFADLAYDNAMPDSAYSWMNENSTVPQATKVLHGARFTMTLPQRTQRTLQLRPEQQATASR